jgi:hypothetical protein
MFSDPNFHCSAHCNENPIYVFLFWELHGRSPNFHIHVTMILGSAHIFSFSRIGRSIVGMWKLGLFLGIFVKNFQNCVFSVHSAGSEPGST